MNRDDIRNKENFKTQGIDDLLIRCLIQEIYGKSFASTLYPASHTKI